MPVTGAIADATRAVLPVTWDALASDQKRYGDALLSRMIETTEERVFGRLIDEAEEETLPLIVINYVAKLAAIELIPAGIDFWMNQETSITTTGTNEIVSFADRAEKLREQREDLLKDTRRMWPEVAPLIDFVPARAGGLPLMNTINDELLTPSPQEFPRPFTRTARS